MSKTMSWLAWAAGLWAFPAGILFLSVTAGRLYPWPELAVDALFALNFFTALSFIEWSGLLTQRTGRGVYLAAGLPLAVAELVAAGSVWYLGGLPV